MLGLLLQSVIAVPHSIGGGHQNQVSHDLLAALAPAPISTIPSAPKQQTLVNSLIGNINDTYTKNFLVRMTQFPERYYQSTNGVAASNWIKDQVSLLIPQTSSDVVLSVKLFAHSFKQPSVIARLEARTNTGPGDIVVVGTHLDTLGTGSGKAEPNNNPAADDCASGSSVIAETLRGLVAAKFVPKRPIEFHWYAGEELGLLGSKDVANSYAKAGTQVICYLNLDQSGYLKPGVAPTAGIFTDYTNKQATALIRSTVSAYTTLKQKDSQCGYACTDHASWNKAGYPAAFAAEGPFENSFTGNDRVNRDGSPIDTLDVINWSHLKQFVRNTLGFVVELSLAP
ncbi:hypothetical protein EDD86DRAFT_138258 [Gorgonomyces haynaldii]|nr:hypothetical protein EDD86DRAFT_138258 [Gorgonomyces haynaldii]